MSWKIKWGALNGQMSALSKWRVANHASSMRLLPWIALALLASGCATRSPQHNHLESQVHRSHPPSLHDQDSSNPKLASALHRFYKRWAGTPYRYGGQSRSGVDCSSFVRQAVDATESYQLPRTTVAQAQTGTRIPRSDLELGDLVFFDTSNVAHHVGIYVGNGRFMHASTSQGVIISRLDNVYWRRHYWQSRRLPD